MPTEATQKTYARAENLPRYGSLNVIRKKVGKGKLVLDVGCASGYLGEILMEQGNTVYGIDGNAQAIEQAKKTYQDAVCMDLNNTEHLSVFGGKKFDVIVFADVLEHLLDPVAVLRYFRQSLQSDGAVVVSLPNVALWRVRLNLLFGRFDYTDYGVLDRTHLHLYTFSSAVALLREAGYRVTWTGSAVNLPLFGKLIRTFPPLRSLLGIHIVLTAKSDHV